MELLKSLFSLLCSFQIISDTHHEHCTDLIAFLFHGVLCAHCINMSSTHSSNQRLSPKFCCHDGQYALLAVQFSVTMQFSDYLDSKKSTVTKRTNKASHNFTGNHHSTESFLSLSIPTLAQSYNRYNKDYLVNFLTTIFDLNTLLELK